MGPDSISESKQLDRETLSRRMFRRERLNRSHARASELNGLAELLCIIQGISDEVPTLCDKAQQRILQAMLDRASAIACRTIRRAALADQLVIAQITNSRMNSAYRGTL